MSPRPLRRSLLILALVLGAGGVAQAARPWYEEYEAGLRALRAKRAGDAIAAFEHAARQRPLPGRNVQTYGTNFIDDYQPYLRLAEACLLVEDVAAARLALERGERFPGEPAAERARVRQQVEVLEERLAARAASRATPAPRSAVPQQTPPPEPDPTPSPLASPAPQTSPWSPYAGAVPAPLASVTPASTVPVVRATPAAAARATPTAPPPAPRSAAATLSLLSSPAGATIYLDDALIGTTDPAHGRLRIPGVEPGRHRLRASRPGYEEVVREVELRGPGAAPVEIVLTPLAAPAPLPAGPPPTAEFPWRAPIAAAVVVALILGALWRHRRGGAREGSMTWTFALPGASMRPPSGRTPAAPTPERTPGGSLRTPRPFETDEVFPFDFGEFTLHGRLGRGGMAIVYAAERAGEAVALKRPLPGYQDDPRFLERFLREAEIGRTLHHPNVVRILDRGEIDGVPFFTMERIVGETLAARLRREGALPEAEVRRILLAVAEALDYGHSKGVVHRDLKPSNVLLAQDGAVKVTDYGIARARRFEGMTATGAFLGSPDYAAPEMIEGQPLDARADLYALGVMAYEMLAGRRPFEAEAPFAVLRLHVSQPPRPLRELVPDVSPALAAEVMQLLAKSPAERQADAESLLLKLREIA